MPRFITAAVIVTSLLSISAAQAKVEKQVTRTVWELSDFPELEKKATAVCESTTLVKSDRLKRACSEKAFPRVTKAGMFYNTGYGAEFNALIRQ